MTRQARLAELQRLIGVLRDLRLAEVARASAAVAEVESAIARLDDLSGSGKAMPEAMPEAEAAARFMCWADARKSGLSQTLAQRRADFLTKQDAARLALGRAEAARRLMR